MLDEVMALFADAGIHVTLGHRDYRPTVSLPGFETKILKPQNMVEMLDAGSREVGFAGADWVAELEVEVVELLDTGLNPVRLVAATTPDFVANGAPKSKPFIVASEFERLTRAWLERRKLNGTFLLSYGATEVLPPEDADYIVDITATGTTLEANGLTIVDEIMTSSTRLYAHPRTLDDPPRRSAIEHLVLLLRSVLDARRRVMVEVNVAPENLEAVIAVLPCMREPTVSPLHGAAGFAVKAAVPRDELPRAIPEIKARGGTDIIVTNLAQIVP